MTDYRVARLLAKLEIPLLLAVPAVMAAALLAGVEQAALAMFVVDRHAHLVDLQCEMTEEHAKART